MIVYMNYGWIYIVAIFIMMLKAYGVYYEL